MPLPPRCRAARSRPPGSWAAGVYSCKFPNRKYIFVKNENIKYKNKKTAGPVREQPKKILGRRDPLGATRGLRGPWDGTHGPTGCHCAWSFLLLSRAPAMHTAPALCSSPRLFSPLKHESFGFTFVRRSSLVPLLLGLRYMEMPFVRFREGT